MGISLSVEEIANIVEGEVSNKRVTSLINFSRNSFSTDTRTIKQGDIYIPLKGENFDGENFIEQAVNSGAIGYLYSKKRINAKIPAIKVDDTKEAYLKLANWYRKNINPKVIMITGSSGKTTTKELVYSVISQKYNTVKTPLNHNNEIGLCQTIFSMDESTEVLIVEAGMRGLGEIELISKYAEPDISIITNVGTAHIGRLGSRENIAKAKCEIVSYQNPKGTLIANDDEIIKNTVKFEGEKCYYSINDVNIIKKEIGFSEFEYKGNKYLLNIEGDYNIENALSAIISGEKLGISYQLIKKGLENYKPIEKRWEIQNISGYNVINDSYNANPDSMKATLNTILDLYSDIVVVLGDMGELGDQEEEYHKQIGQFINQKNKTKPVILTVGDLSKHISNEIKCCFTKNFENNESVARYILANIKIGNTIFLKASRAMKFEEILMYLKGEVK